jgi:dipeptidyl aminopeptidase/acylaminoacyl peptidase
MDLMEENTAMATTSVESMFGRFLFSGVSYGELSAVMARWQASDNWYDAWFDGAERLAHQAMQAEGSRETLALHCWLEASAMYHFAQFHLFDDTSAKRLAQDRCEMAYQRCASLLSPPGEVLVFTASGINYTGYLRVPKQEGPVPCVILLNGLDSVKEVELHHWSEVFLQSGIATFAFEGPGQGKIWRIQKLSDEYEKLVSKAISTLSQDSRVDSARMGVFGLSFGGYLACRAATNPLVRAAVDLAGPFDYQFLKDARPALQQNFCYAFATPTIDELFRQVQPLGLQVLPAPVCPLLVIHGKQDQSIPYDHAERIWSWAEGEAELHSFADGDHVCTNRFSEVTALVADWFTSHLGESAQSSSYLAHSL